MITRTLLFILALLTLPTAAKSQKTRHTQAKAESQLSTAVHFDDSVLYGRYNSADEAVATVEDEKSLNRLLGVRLDFKDRLQKSVELK